MRTTPETQQSTMPIIVRAEATDILTIVFLVKAAYTKYIERIGREPAPMTADYDQLLQSHEIYVLRTASVSLAPSSHTTLPGHNISPDPNIDHSILGSIIVKAQDTSLHIDNLVVQPNAQGRGYGRLLMDFAEQLARERGLRRLQLYTNVKMWENVKLYEKLGFKETERKVEDGFERVYFEKFVD